MNLRFAGKLVALSEEFVWKIHQALEENTNAAVRNVIVSQDNQK